jgi:hypothetical protein
MSKAEGLVRLEGLDKLGKGEFNDPIGTRTRGVPACSIVSQSFTLPRRVSYQIVYALRFSSMHATCPSIIILVDLIILTPSHEERNVNNSHYIALYSFLSLHNSLSVSAVFSNTLGLCSSSNARDQVLHPYRTTDTFTALHILILMFSNIKRGHTEASELNVSKLINRNRTAKNSFFKICRIFQKNFMFSESCSELLT